MDVLEAIAQRRSIRKFSDKKISGEVLAEILKAAGRAPSAKNRQPWKFVVITDQSKDDFISVLVDGIAQEKEGPPVLPHSAKYIVSAENSIRIMAEAPVTILVINTENENELRVSQETKFYEMANIQSIGAAIENMLLAAEHYGIGSLWICDIFFAYQNLCEWLGTNKQIIAAISLGYPAEKPFPRPRRGLDEIVEWK